MTEDRFEDLFENAPCGYIVLLPNGRITMVSNAIVSWTGVPREGLLGKRIHDILQFSSRIFFETHVFPLLRLQGFVNEIAIDFVTAGGDKLSTIANATEQRDKEGRPLSIRLGLLQATDRRKYERELVSARAQAEDVVAAEREASELREQFIAVLGHDLRNPLASIASGVRMLGKEIISQRGQRVIAHMEGSIVRSVALVTNVLDFARGRLGGGLTLSRQKNAPLRAVLDQVVAEVRTISPSSAIETHFAIDREIDCDPIRVGQLASNLLSNAISHGASDQTVRLSCVSTEDRLELWIANAGAPISLEAHSRLFQPFFRDMNGTSQKGLGLGLYIASEIAKAHGGKLSVASSVLETRFTFTMPLDASK